VGRAESALRLAGALRWFWLLRDYLTEGLAWLEQALVRRETVAPGVPIAALDGAMFLAMRTGDIARAAVWGRELLARCRAQGDGPGAVSALIWLGNVADYRGDHAEAQALLDEGLALARTAGAPWTLAVALHFRGTLAYSRGEYAAARASMEESLALLRALGDRALAAMILAWLGRVAARQGEYGRARTLQEESLAIKQALGMRRAVAVSCQRLGLVAALEGKSAEAARWHEQALQLSKDTGDRAVVLESLAGLAGVAAARGQPAQAARLFGAVTALRGALGFVLDTGERAQMERDVAAVRAQLDAEAFAAAWAAGRALTLDQAIAEALTPGPAAETATSPAPLTAREFEVAAHIAAGLTNRQIAAALSLSPHTVERHVEHILNKLGLGSRAQVAAWTVAHTPSAPAGRRGPGESMGNSP
jgi:non-specific serine/threonine protein kinase